MENRMGNAIEIKEAIKWMQAFPKTIETSRVACETAISALEKQIPAKPDDGDCPVCGEYLSDGVNNFDYCPYCGQAIDWESEVEDEAD